MNAHQHKAFIMEREDILKIVNEKGCTYQEAVDEYQTMRAYKAAEMLPSPSVPEKQQEQPQIEM